MCTGEEGRERKGTLTSKAGGGQGVVSTKILWEQKKSPLPGLSLKGAGPGFFPGYFHRETEEKYNQKKSLAV